MFEFVRQILVKTLFKEEHCSEHKEHCFLMKIYRQYAIIEQNQIGNVRCL